MERLLDAVDASFELASSSTTGARKGKKRKLAFYRLSANSVVGVDFKSVVESMLASQGAAEISFSKDGMRAELRANDGSAAALLLVKEMQSSGIGLSSVRAAEGGGRRLVHCGNVVATLRGADENRADMLDRLKAKDQRVTSEMSKRVGRQAPKPNLNIKQQMTSSNTGPAKSKQTLKVPVAMSANEADCLLDSKWPPKDAKNPSLQCRVDLLANALQSSREAIRSSSSANGKTDAARWEEICVDAELQLCFFRRCVEQAKHCKRSRGNII